MIHQCLADQFDLLATDKSQCFAQPHPIIVNYLQLDDCHSKIKNFVPLLPKLMFSYNKRIHVLIFCKKSLVLLQTSSVLKNVKLVFSLLFFSYRPEGKDYSVHRIILGTHTYANPLLFF